MSIDYKRVIKSPYLLLSTGFGIGLIPFAPGTLGSGLGLCLYIFFAHFSYPNVNGFILLVLLLMIGTFIESWYSTDTAKIWVYNAWWFELILALFMFNFLVFYIYLNVAFLGLLFQLFVPIQIHLGKVLLYSLPNDYKNLVEVLKYVFS